MSIPVPKKLAEKAREHAYRAIEEISRQLSTAQTLANVQRLRAREQKWRKVLANLEQVKE